MFASRSQRLKSSWIGFAYEIRSSKEDAQIIIDSITPAILPLNNPLISKDTTNVYRPNKAMGNHYLAEVRLDTQKSLGYKGGFRIYCEDVGTERCRPIITDILSSLHLE